MATYGPETMPIVEYELKINNSTIAFGSNTKVSFNSPYNKVDVTIKATNCSLHLCYGAITKYITTDASGSETTVTIDAIELFNEINIGTDVPYNTSFDITKEKFKYGDVKYCIELYAQNDEGTWDITQIFFTFGGASKFISKDSDALEVLTNTSI